MERRDQLIDWILFGPIKVEPEDENDSPNDHSPGPESADANDSGNSAPSQSINPSANKLVKRLRHEYTIIQYSELEKKDPYLAKRVLTGYNIEKKKKNIHLCALLLDGRCNYFSRDAICIFRHMKRIHRGEEELRAVKVVGYPGSERKKNRTIHQYVTKSYPDLAKINPALAQRVLNHFRRPQNMGKRDIHLCGLVWDGKCEYFSNTEDVRAHINRHHSRQVVDVIKVVSYPHPKKRTRHDCESMKFADLQKVSPQLAQRVLTYYNEKCKKYKANVHLCGLVLTGECAYFSRNSLRISIHTKCNHEQNEKFRSVKVTGYPGQGNRAKTFHQYLTKTHSDLVEMNPPLAQQVLDHYQNSQNKSNKNVHLCGLVLGGKCEYYSYRGVYVDAHIRSNHITEAVPVIKVVAYPCSIQRYRHEYELMPFADLHKKSPKLAQRVLIYYSAKCKSRKANVHLCGLSVIGQCGYMSYNGNETLNHIKSRHPQSEGIIVYKIIGWPDN